MDAQEFVDWTVGKPWEDRATGPDAWDCWGIVVKYYELVKGIRLPEVVGYADGRVSIIDGFFGQVESGKWRQGAEGVVFMAFQGGQPTHCGVVIDGYCLHAAGATDRPGQVCFHRLRTLQRIYDDIQFWEFVG